MKYWAFSASNYPLCSVFFCRFGSSVSCVSLPHSLHSISLGWSRGQKPPCIWYTVSCSLFEKAPFPVPYPAAELHDGTMYSRPNRKCFRCRHIPLHRPAKYSFRYRSYSKSESGRLPICAVTASCGAGSRPSFARWVVFFFSWFILCFPVPCRSPESHSCPIPAAYPCIGTLPGNFGPTCPEVRFVAVLPLPPYRRKNLFPADGSQRHRWHNRGHKGSPQAGQHQRTIKHGSGGNPSDDRGSRPL